MVVRDAEPERAVFKWPSAPWVKADSATSHVSLHCWQRLEVPRVHLARIETDHEVRRDAVRE